MAIIFDYTFDGIECAQLDNANTQDPDPARSDVSRSNDNVTDNGRGWEITTAANYSGGGGGNGFRHWRGDGTGNACSGGITITLPGSYTELWLRWYMRYQSGFTWVNNDPGYTKDIYGSEHVNYWIYGIQNDGWGVSDISSANHDGVSGPGASFTWADLMGGTTGDGQWHCHEFHINRAGAGAGVIEVWIDDDWKFTETGLTLHTDAMSSFRIGSNQSEPTGAGAADYYTDYDDIAVSDSGRVGPLSGGSTPKRGSSVGGLG